MVLGVAATAGRAARSLRGARTVERDDGALGAARSFLHLAVPRVFVEGRSHAHAGPLSMLG